MAPFRHKVFAILWVAIVISNTGTWMHDVAAGWLMATMTPSPVLVAAIQAATTLPIFIFALPAGALADIIDRRRLLIVVKSALTIVAIALGLVVLSDQITPASLLVFTVMMGAGAAFIAPAWQAIVPQLVPRRDLQQAIAMNSVGINISRAIGPALGGVIIATVGIAVPFILNAVSFCIVIAVLIWWRPAGSQARSLPSERFTGAIRAGLRYAGQSGPLRSTIFRALGFFLFATGYWALLPLIARDLLGGEASYYGYLLGAIGAGAVLSALGLPALRRRLGANRTVVIGSTGTALVLILFAVSTNQIVGLIASFLAGASWLAVLTSFNVSAQLALPEWVRARGLSAMLMVYFGAMAGGALIWGAVADQIGIPGALLAAAAGCLLAIPVTWRFRLLEDSGIDMSPSMHWSLPVVAHEIEDDRGPVMVTMEWRIDPEKAEGFLDAMNELGRTRRRDGAFTWGVYEDTAEPGLYLEYFLVSSWLEHNRQHGRVTEADKEIEENVLKYQVDGVRPRARHLVAPQGD